jgi:hypothetical protein
MVHTPELAPEFFITITLCGSFHGNFETGSIDKKPGIFYAYYFLYQRAKS